MNKLALVKLLEIRGVYALEKGQSVGQTIRDTGGDASIDELQEVIRKCAIHYLDLLEAQKEKIEKLQKRAEDMERDVYWLRCLKGAGLDNWDGCEFAGEQFREIYPED